MKSIILCHAAWKAIYIRCHGDMLLAAAARDRRRGITSHINPLHFLLLFFFSFLCIAVYNVTFDVTKLDYRTPFSSDWWWDVYNELKMRILSVDCNRSINWTGARRREEATNCGGRRVMSRTRHFVLLLASSALFGWLNEARAFIITSTYS